MGQDTLRTSVPQIDEELAESLRVLADLEARLPAIRTQASQVQRVYDSGRRKVCAASYSKTRKKNARVFLISLLVVAYVGRSARAGSQMAES